jgi:hypothetical protein
LSVGPQWLLTTRRHHTKILSSGNNLKQLSIAPPDVAGQRNVKGHSGREEEDKARQAPNGRAKEFSSNPCQYLEYMFSSVISGIIHPSIQEIEEIGEKLLGDCNGHDHPSSTPIKDRIP